MVLRDKGILLESGTNELEIVEFLIGEVSYGINVAKVREIIRKIPSTKLPHCHPSVKGLILYRNQTLTLLDIGSYLDHHSTSEYYIITHFNQLSLAIAVCKIIGIKRYTWNDIKKPPVIMGGKENNVLTGIIENEDRVTIILDFEKIINEINPDSGIKESEVLQMGKREQCDRPIVIVEDSATLKKIILKCLTTAGFTNLITFENGQEAWHYLSQLPNDQSEKEKVACVITDIEMPEMDGHKLTCLIRESKDLTHIPIILFSSLINESMKIKGEKIGASAQISKPEIARLVELMDQLISKL